VRASCRTVAPDAALTCFAVVFDWYLDGVVVELERSFSVAASPRRSNLQIEIALAGLASKVVLGAIATAGWPQISDHFIGYPATGTLEIVSTDRHEAAEALSTPHALRHELFLAAPWSGFPFAPLLCLRRRLQ